MGGNEQRGSVNFSPPGLLPCKRRTMSTFELFSDKAGQFRFRLKAANGQIILASQGYSSKAAAEGGIASVKANAPEDGNYERKSTAAGASFNLLAANGQVVGTSQVYGTNGARDAGIDSVKINAPKAAVEEVNA